jgi:hypothetical protein
VGNLDKKIADELGPLSFGALLQEGWLWLRILERDRPRGWTPAVLRDIEFSLQEIQMIYGDVRLDTEEYEGAHERLTGFCHRMRRGNGGASAHEVITRRRTG